MSIRPNFAVFVSFTFDFNDFCSSLSAYESRNFAIPVASINAGNLNGGFSIPLFPAKNALF